MYMSKINKLTTLAETKFLNLYNAEYSNKGGNIKNWIIASRKEKENLEGVYLNNKELQDDAVLIVPFHKEEEKIVVIRQFRVPINSYIYEMPAGLIDKGESPQTAITRELKEETGLDVIEILKNTVKGQLFLSPGMTDESVTSVFCTCGGTISKAYMEEDEDIEPILLSQKEAQELLIKDVKFDIKCYIYLQEFAKSGNEMFK
ncbi:NUDIX hydrolase [uncultured Clostridium sp.]|uniref:NUDIX hydrolase n=1 Tax=uncultured Clostridium sp. TaxID=59620 RepID=UPI002673DFF6|nr:NUDIX hydrolase [uncultured Clostridium sp.]